MSSVASDDERYRHGRIDAKDLAKQHRDFIRDYAIRYDILPDLPSKEIIKGIFYERSEFIPILPEHSWSLVKSHIVLTERREHPKHKHYLVAESPYPRSREPDSAFPNLPEDTYSPSASPAASDRDRSSPSRSPPPARMPFVYPPVGPRDAAGKVLPIPEDWLDLMYQSYEEDQNALVADLNRLTAETKEVSVEVLRVMSKIKEEKDDTRRLIDAVRSVCGEEMLDAIMLDVHRTTEFELNRQRKTAGVKYPSVLYPEGEEKAKKGGGMVRSSYFTYDKQILTTTGGAMFLRDPDDLVASKRDKQSLSAETEATTTQYQTLGVPGSSRNVAPVSNTSGVPRDTSQLRGDPSGRSTAETSLPSSTQPNISPESSAITGGGPHTRPSGPPGPRITAVPPSTRSSTAAAASTSTIRGRAAPGSANPRATSSQTADAQPDLFDKYVDRYTKQEMALQARMMNPAGWDDADSDSGGSGSGDSGSSDSGSPARAPSASLVAPSTVPAQPTTRRNTQTTQAAAPSTSTLRPSTDVDSVPTFRDEWEKQAADLERQLAAHSATGGQFHRPNKRFRAIGPEDQDQPPSNYKRQKNARRAADNYEPPSSSTSSSQPSATLWDSTVAQPGSTSGATSTNLPRRPLKRSYERVHLLEDGSWELRDWRGAADTTEDDQPSRQSKTCEETIFDMPHYDKNLKDSRRRLQYGTLFRDLREWSNERAPMEYEDEVLIPC